MKLNPFRDGEKIGDLIKEQIIKAEIEIPGPKKGDEKKEQVIAFLLEMIDIPVLPKVAERILWTTLISLAVNILQDTLLKTREERDAAKNARRSKRVAKKAAKNEAAE